MFAGYRGPWFWKWGVVLAVLMNLGAACEDEQQAALVVNFPEEGGTQSVLLSEGQIFEVALPGNPTTGYSWTVEDWGAHDVLSGSMEPEFQPENAERLGAGGVFRFRFTARRSGSVTLRFQYRRSWESRAAHRATLDVTIR